jgi:outer membrane protein assembly factor BamE
MAERLGLHSEKSTVQNTINTIRQNFLILCLACLGAACVYEVDVQQGNKLEPHDIEAVEAGMTRNQIRYLLGTQVVSNLFDDTRWDYVYYFKKGRNKNPERRWIIIWFDGNVVREIERDLLTAPSQQAN